MATMKSAGNDLNKTCGKVKTSWETNPPQVSTALEKASKMQILLENIFYEITRYHDLNESTANKLESVLEAIPVKAAPDPEEMFCETDLQKRLNEILTAFRDQNNRHTSINECIRLF